ncbi:MAG: hypothetical protein SFY80_00265 [Verrucomicrobiota bacterium]|nr:hypothetical protein [Verrucomicrobiota bacterium]
MSQTKAVNTTSSRRRRRWYFGIAVALVLIGLGVLGVQQWREFAAKNQAALLATIDEAIRAGDFSRASQLLAVPLKVAPEETAVLERAAQLLSRTNPREGVAVWTKLRSSDPHNLEYGVALVLCQIKCGDLEGSRKVLTSWPTSQQRTSAYHRAGLAHAFASGEAATALMHAKALVLLNPDSEQDRFTLAQLQAGETVGQQMLWSFADNEARRSQALRLLAQAYVKAQDKPHLQQVLTKAREPWADREPHTLLWALEAESQMEEIVNRAEITRLWALAYNNPQAPVFQQLLLWLNHTKQSTLIFDLLDEYPVDNIWAPPTGFPMVEAALIAGREETARRALLSMSWPDSQALHHFCLARLLDSSELGNLWLDKAVTTTNSRLAHLRLLHIARAWGWLDGEYALTLAILANHETIPLAEMVPLITEIESRGNTEALYALFSKLHARTPDNAILLNNAAYYGLLLNKREAFAWAQEAHRQNPENSQIAATMALAQALNRDWDAAQHTIATITHAEDALLPKLLLMHQRLEPIPSTMQTLAESLRLPEERKLLERVFN